MSLTDSKILNLLRKPVKLDIGVEKPGCQDEFRLDHEKDDASTMASEDSKSEASNETNSSNTIDQLESKTINDINNNCSPNMHRRYSTDDWKFGQNDGRIIGSRKNSEQIFNEQNLLNYNREAEIDRLLEEAASIGLNDLSIINEHHALNNGSSKDSKKTDDDLVLGPGKLISGPGRDLIIGELSRRASAVTELNVPLQSFDFPHRNSEGWRATEPNYVASAGECPMDKEHFRHHGYSMIDYICKYLDTVKDRRVSTFNVVPGYLRSMMPTEAPVEGESFPKIMEDFERKIMPGITHWQHPQFHAYFPSGNSYASQLGDMLGNAFGGVGFSWICSPAFTELEIIMLDWMAKMIGLPEQFLNQPDNGKESRGGGVIQGSASDCVLVNMIAARNSKIEKLQLKYPDEPDGMLLSRLVAYCSKEAHSSVVKAGLIAFIRMRTLDTDEKQSLRGETLAKAIEADLEQGLEPFFVCATLGTTSCVSFDNLDELGSVCEKHDIWLHVDAAYAGSAFVCPEFKYLIRGIDKVTSFSMNPTKWMLINFDCSLMWVKDRFKLTQAFIVDPLYLQNSHSDQTIDFRHWGIPLSRRFRSLKLWFVIRNYGIKGVQEYIRNHVQLAKYLESLFKKDTRFIVCNEVLMGLVCFRLIGSDDLNKRLLATINASGKIFIIPASIDGQYVLRLCISYPNAKEEDVRNSYEFISEIATEVLASKHSDQK